MTSEKQSGPSSNWGHEQSGGSGGNAGADSSTSGSTAKPAGGTVIHIPPGAWARLDREREQLQQAARDALKLLAPWRSCVSTQCISIGRSLRAKSVDLLPVWVEFTKGNPAFTPEVCAQHWREFGERPDPKSSYGLLVFLVRKDTNNPLFGKRGAS